MTTETILRNGKKIIKTTENGKVISYKMKGAYVGKDALTGKQVTTTITAKTLRQLDRLYNQAKIDFQSNGSTRKTKVIVNTLEELAEEWYKTYQTLVSSHNTLNKVRGYLDNYIIPQFGSYKIDQLKPIAIQSWVNTLAIKARESVEAGHNKSLKGCTKEFSAIAKKLQEILDYGVTNFELETNPASSIIIPPKPKAKKEKIMVLHDDELSKWMSYLDGLSNTRANRRFKVICNTLLASALRINELLALTIDDLDFTNSSIVVDKTLLWKSADKKSKTKGMVICKDTPKTDAGNRSVAVPISILEDLKGFHNEMNSYFKLKGIRSTNLIFPTIYGNYMCDRNERTTLKNRLSSLNLPDYGFHLFRHTHASMMLNAGMNWKELQIRMGHKSISTTMDIYAELAPKRKLEAIDLYLEKLSHLTA